MNYDELIEQRQHLQHQIIVVEMEILRIGNPSAVIKKQKKARRQGSRSTQIPDTWWPEPEMLKAMREKVSNIQFGTETEKFKNYYKARGKAMKDWNACWRNWMLQAGQYNGG